MSDPTDIDPTKPEEQGAAGGAPGGGDDPRDWSLPGDPSNPDEQRRRWPGGARPKDPYRYENFLKKRADYPSKRVLQKPLSLTLRGIWTTL